MTFSLPAPRHDVPTVGVEIEHMIIDPATRALHADTSRILADGAEIYGGFIRPEFHAPVVEVLSAPCATVAEVGEQLTELRRTLMGLARKHGGAVLTASTHPIANWREVKLTEGERYAAIEKSLGDVARSNLICGLHVHVGIQDPDARIEVMNGARAFLPFLLALTASSPFWQGRDTGLASVRTGIFRRFPRTGLPPRFDDAAGFEAWVDLLVRTGSIQDAKNIYWDVRPHPQYPTLEFRICDVPPRLDETLAVVSLVQALVARLLGLWRRGMGYRNFHRSFIDENVYRAMGHAMEADFIDLRTKEVRPAKELLHRLLDDLTPEFEGLGLTTQAGHLRQLVDGGSSAARQRRVFAETGSMEAVVDHLVEESQAGV